MLLRPRNSSLAPKSRRFASALILLRGQRFTRKRLYDAIGGADEIDKSLTLGHSFDWQSPPRFPMRTFNRYVKQSRDKGILRAVRVHRRSDRRGRPPALYRVDVRALTHSFFPDGEYRKEVMARAKNRALVQVIPIRRPGFKDPVAVASLFALRTNAESEARRRARARELGSLFPWATIARQMRLGDMIVIGPRVALRQ